MGFIIFFCSGILWFQKKKTTFTCKFIPHLREGNRRTQAIEALRSLLFIGVPGTCDAYTLWYSYTANFEVLFNKQEIPITMTGISLLPFYSADATTKLARALSCYKGKHYFFYPAQ